MFNKISIFQKNFDCPVIITDTKIQMHMTKHNQIAYTGNQGSITVMIAFLLPIMLLMVMLIVNINHLVFTKIKLQNTVDACALSAAAVQAAGLNEIADLNFEMNLEFEKMSLILGSDVWHNFMHAQDARDFFYNYGNNPRGVIDWIMHYQSRANINYAKWAEDVSEDVRKINFPETRLVARHNSSKLTELKSIPGSAGFGGSSYVL